MRDKQLDLWKPNIKKQYLFINLSTSAAGPVNAVFEYVNLDYPYSSARTVNNDNNAV